MDKTVLKQVPAESEPGKGAAFRLWLPVQQAANEQA